MPDRLATPFYDTPLRQEYMRAGMRRLSLEDAIAVYEAATPEEKSFLRDEFERKERLLDRTPKDSRARLRRRFQKAIGITPSGV